MLSSNDFSLKLYNAAKHGKYAEVKKLLPEILKREDVLEILNSQHDDEEGVVNKNPKGATALYAAVRGGHLEIVEALLNEGASPNLATHKNSISPLYLAMVQYRLATVDKNPNKEKIPTRLNIIKALSKAGADYEQPSSSGRLPLDFIEGYYPIFLCSDHYPIKLDDNFWDDDFLCPMHEQNWMTLFMHALNYMPTLDGVCNGIGNAAGESLLIENGFKEFNRRLKEIYLITLEAIQKAYRELREEHTLSTGEPFCMGEDIWRKKVKDILFVKMKQPNVEKDKKNEMSSLLLLDKGKENEISVQDKLNENEINILSFCDKVEIYQHINHHNELLPAPLLSQNNRLASEIVESRNLSVRGGKKGVCRFSGMYTLEEMILYFASMRKMLEADNFPHPISLTLAGYGHASHAITIGFDKEKKRWILIDPNGMQYLQDDALMAKEVFEGFSYNFKKIATIRSEMFIAQYNSVKEYRRILTCSEEPTLEDMQIDDLMAMRNKGELIIYWIENGRLVSRSFEETSVPWIIKNLPDIGEPSTNLELINEITTKYNCPLAKNEKSNLKKIKPFVEQWQNTEAWKSLHTVTSEKALRKSEDGLNWKQIAIKSGEPEVAKECVKKEYEGKNFFLRHWKSIAIGIGISLVVVGAAIGIGIATAGVGPALAGIASIGIAMGIGNTTLATGVSAGILALGASLITTTGVCALNRIIDQDKISEAENAAKERIPKFIPLEDEENNAVKSCNSSTFSNLNKKMLANYDSKTKPANEITFSDSVSTKAMSTKMWSSKSPQINANQSEQNPPSNSYTYKKK